eukprot:518018_1
MGNSRSRPKKMKEWEYENCESERHHEERMKNLEYADKNIKRKDKKEGIERLQKEIESTENIINKETETIKLETINVENEQNQIAKLRDDINGFDIKKKENLQAYAVELQLDAAHHAFKTNDDEIKKAIIKTGQHEDNVAKFLNLTHGLIGATMSSDVETNKLDAALSTFGVLINNE